MKRFQGFDIEDKKFTLNCGKVIILKVLRTRVKSFSKKFGDVQDVVFPLPAKSLARRIDVHYYERFHRDVDIMVAAIRQKLSVTGLRKIVSTIDKNYRGGGKKLPGQVKGNLPNFSKIFSKDSVVCRGPKVKMKVQGEWKLCRVKEVYPDEDKKVRNVSVIVPPPSVALSKGLDYRKNLVMNELKSILIVIAASDHSEIEALGGSVKS